METSAVGDNSSNGSSKNKSVGGSVQSVGDILQAEDTIRYEDESLVDTIERYSRLVSKGFVDVLYAMTRIADAPTVVDRFYNVIEGLQLVIYAKLTIVSTKALIK